MIHLSQLERISKCKSPFASRFTLDADEVHVFLEAAEDIFHDDGNLAGAQEEATNEESVFTIEGNTSVIFALGQAYQQTGLQGLVEYEVL